MLTIDKLKSLLGISVGDCRQDTPLAFIIDDVSETILNYCNRNEWPAGLDNTGYRMAIDLYRNEGVGTADVPSSVSALTEGDTMVQFKKDDALAGTLLKNYEVQLNRYRRVSWT